MDYQGKLYGRIGDTHFDTGHTAEEFDQMLEALKEAQRFHQGKYEPVGIIIRDAIKKATKK